MPELMELNISDIAYQGKGVARLDGKVVFVNGVITGETVMAEPLITKKKFAEARLVSIKTPSADRTKPVCPLAFRVGREPNSFCPGCCYQHMEYKTELSSKIKQFRDLFNRLGGITLPDPPPTIQSGPCYDYRNKITLHAFNPVDSGQSTVSLGYFTDDNRSVLDVPSCPLAYPAINSKLAELRKDAKFMAGLSTHMKVTFRHTEKDGVIFWTSRDTTRPPMMTESTPFGDLKVSADSFFQVNHRIMEKLILAVSEIVARSKPRKVIDLYCGTGLFAITASKSGAREVIGIDFDHAAIETAGMNAASNGVRNARFISSAVSKITESFYAELKGAGVTMIVDPPRRGLDLEVLSGIAKALPDELIYISCAPDTLARDVKALVASGYALVSTNLFDMFPRTQYFESISLLKKQ